MKYADGLEEAHKLQRGRFKVVNGISTTLLDN